MTAASNTLYTVMLFLALAVFNLWTERRRRMRHIQSSRQPLRLRLRTQLSTLLTIENDAVHVSHRR